MNTEMVKPQDYGIETTKAKELTLGLKIVKEERELLIKEFEEVSKLEIVKENLPKFKALRLKIVKNRTQGINNWHKKNKEFFLTGGKFVDAIKNKEIAINEDMEERLNKAEKHFENLEKERLVALQLERVSLISEFLEDADERDLSAMDDDVWNAYLSTKKESYFKKIEEDKKLEEIRLAEIEAERKEQERIKLENAKLKAEADEREKQLKIEAEKREKEERLRLEKENKERLERQEKQRKELAKHVAELKAQKEAKEKLEKLEKLKREKIQAELDAKLEAERKAKEEEERNIQKELNKGDEDKVKDLISDLEAIKTKYNFKSVKNKKMYVEVGYLIDKINSHISK